MAALTEPLVGRHAGVNRAQVRPGDKVVVFGWVRSASAWCCGSDAASMTSSRSTSLTNGWKEHSELGARAVINPAKENVRARLRECTVPHACSAGKRWARMRTSMPPGRRASCRRREHGEAACASGGDGCLHETGSPRSRRHADHRDDHNDGRRLSDRDAGCHRGASTPARKVRSLISHRFRFDKVSMR